MTENPRIQRGPVEPEHIWIDHDGGACPVPGEEDVWVRFHGSATGELRFGRACRYNWANVRAYRLTGPSA